MRRRYGSAAFSLGLAVAMWVVSIGPTADWLMADLEEDRTIAQDPRGDVIIVLGGGVHSQAPDLSGTGAPDASSLERMITAARLYRRLGAPILVSGGIVDPADVPVAVAIRRFLIDLGVPQDHVIIDVKSRDTYENAIFSKRLCEKMGFSQPLLVTSGYHVRRARFCFEQVGLHITAVPCGLTTWPGKEYNWRDLLPSATSLHVTSAALHERLGLFYYRLIY